MAEAFIADNQERLFHRAFLHKKLPCPHETCHHSTSTYSREGIDHHFRTIHKTRATKQTIDEASALLKRRHSEETLSCIKKYSEKYKTEVFHGRCTQQSCKSADGVIFFGFQVGEDEANEFEVGNGGFFIKVHCQTAEYGAKLFGSYLFHRGSLNPYTKGSAPQVVEVTSLSSHVKFNTWFHERSTDMVDIIVESFYVRVVGISVRKGLNITLIFANEIQ